MGLLKTIHEGQVTDVYVTDVEGVGSERISADGTKRYRFVKLVDLDGAAYKMTVMADADGWDVTQDVADGSALPGLWATGMLLGAVVIATAPYCWVQRTGITTFTAGSANIVAGDPLKVDTAENGDLEEATEGTDANICAVAMADVIDNATGLCMLKDII